MDIQTDIQIRQVDRHMAGQTYGQKHTQTEGQIDTWKYRQKDKQMQVTDASDRCKLRRSKTCLKSAPRWFYETSKTPQDGSHRFQHVVLRCFRRVKLDNAIFRGCIQRTHCFYSSRAFPKSSGNVLTEPYSIFQCGGAHLLRDVQ